MKSGRMTSRALPALFDHANIEDIANYDAVFPGLPGRTGWEHVQRTNGPQPCRYRPSHQSMMTDGREIPCSSSQPTNALPVDTTMAALGPSQGREVTVRRHR